MENNFLITIGKRIGEVRRQNSITQELMAEKLDVTPKHISHAECGTSSLSLKNLMEFCRICNCSLDYIVFGSQNSVLEKLPEEIVSILYTGSNEDIDRLNRYLQIYIELSKKQG
jgi:transcriptional regulator with XRE-family HTH domain